MTNEEIKADCEAQYKAIRKAEQRIRDLRIECQHNETHEGIYSFRSGSMEPAIICSTCGQLIKLLELNG